MTDATQEQPTQEQITAIRQSLFNTIHAEYLNFINSIRNLPIHPGSFSQAFIEFDTGILWAKEAIFHGPFVQAAPAPTEPAEEAECAAVLDSVESEAAVA